MSCTSRLAAILVGVLLFTNEAVHVHAMDLRVSPATSAAAPGTREDEMDNIRRSYVELRRDLLLAEPVRLVPANSEVAVYVSVDSRAKVTLEAASLAVNDQLVCDERYTEPQLAALQRDAASRLYVGTLPAGTTSLLITLAGHRPSGKSWTQSASLALGESAGPRYVEFRLARTSTKGLPDILAQATP